jgi:hypothetical protein
MAFGAAEAILLTGLVLALFWLLRPLRRRLERWFARRLRRVSAGGGRVVVLERRRDGTFGREGDHDDR